MKKIIFLVIILSSLLTGCTQYRQLELGDITFRSLNFKNTTSIEITCDIEVKNPSKYVISVDKLDAALYKEDMIFAEFDLVDVPVIPAKSEEKVSVTLRATVSDPLALITTGLDFDNWNMEDFTIDGKIVLASDGKYKKVINLNHIPLDVVISYIR